MRQPMWQPDSRLSWSRTDTLAADLMGLREQAAAILGKTEYRSLIDAMAQAFDQWARVWLRYALDAGWFAHFLRTDSGQVLLPQGIKQLANLISSFKDDDWHRHGLGTLFSEALDACWNHAHQHIESDLDLRAAFLRMLTELTARQVPEALHLRQKVSEFIGASSKQ